MDSSELMSEFLHTMMDNPLQKKTKQSPRIRPVLVAEMSCNHAQSLSLAKESIVAAKNAGADAVKIQTYKPSCLTLNIRNELFKIKGGIWDGEYLYDLYARAMLPWEWHLELFNFAKFQGIELFSSPFSLDALELLESLDCPRYKIASFECIDFDFIYAVACTKKPMILSTGIATSKEIEMALNACVRGGSKDITLLQCTSAYPAKTSEANILGMLTLGERFSSFGVKWGLSDHTLGNLCGILATALGASMIEKHFILHKDIESLDREFSLDEMEFMDFSRAVCEAFYALGSGEIRNMPDVKGRVFARSLYVIEDIKKGEMFTHKNIASKRPYNGLNPEFLSLFLGRQSICDLRVGDPLKMSYIKE